MGSEVLLLSQELTTGTCPETHESSSPGPISPYLTFHFNITITYKSAVSKCSSSQIYRPKSLVCVILLCYYTWVKILALQTLLHARQKYCNSFLQSEIFYNKTDKSEPVQCSIVAGLQAGQTGCSNPSTRKMFFSSKMSRLAIGPTQPPTQWVPGFLPEGKAAAV